MDTGLAAFFRRNPDFPRFYAGMLLVQFGVQIQAVTIGWQVYAVARQTRSVEASAFLVGMVGLVVFLPLFFLALIGGATADRVDRRRIVAVALGVEACCALGLTAVALSESPSLPAIFAIAAFFGAARAWLSPATTAITPMLVTKPDMSRAISLKSLGWQVGGITGPFLGGLLVAVSPAAAYATAAALYLAGLVSLAFIVTSTRPQLQPGNRMQQIREGLVYVWTNKLILGAMSLDLFAVLLGGATALLPAFAHDVLHVGPTGFGLLRSGPALGAAVMAIWLTLRPIQRHAGVRMFWAVAAFGLATIVFGLSKNLYLSIAALAALGAADMISVFVRQTLVQVVTPDHMRGRVSSVSGLFISGSNELGEFESGVVARLIGPVGAAVFGGVGTLVVTGTWAQLFPELRRADRLDGSDQPPAPAAPHATAAAAPLGAGD
jgi:MFS family permease